MTEIADINCIINNTGRHVSLHIIEVYLLYLDQIVHVVHISILHYFEKNMSMYGNQKKLLFLAFDYVLCDHSGFFIPPHNDQ